jgi:hypothetical protein
LDDEERMQTMYAKESEASGRLGHLQSVNMRPSQLGPDDVLIRVQAADVNPADSNVRDRRYAPSQPLLFPVILVSDFAGRVAWVGERMIKVGVGVSSRPWTTARDQAAPAIPGARTGSVGGRRETGRPKQRCPEFSGRASRKRALPTRFLQSPAVGRWERKIAMATATRETETTEELTLDRVPALIGAMRELGLDGEASPFGRWIRIQGTNGPVYVSASAFGLGYYTWDDAGHRQRAGPFDDPCAAICMGLWRAYHASTERPASRPAGE